MDFEQSFCFFLHVRFMRKHKCRNISKIKIRLSKRFIVFKTWTMATVSDFRELVPIPSLLNDGLRKAKLLPTIESLRSSEKFLVSRLQCKIQVGRGLFCCKVGWTDYNVALSPTDRVFVFYTASNSGHIVPVDDAYKFKIYIDKKQSSEGITNKTVVQLKYDFGIIKVKIPKDENLQLWLSMFSSAHFPDQAVDFSSIFEKISHKHATVVSIQRLYNCNQPNFSINVQRKLKKYTFRNSIDKCRENALPPVSEHHHEHFYFFVFDNENNVKMTTTKTDSEGKEVETCLKKEDPSTIAPKTLAICD